MKKEGNKILKKAIEMDEYSEYHTLPDVEIGDIITLSDIWDGEGGIPEDSYSYLLKGDKSTGDYINYKFRFLDDSEEHGLNSNIQITDIEFV